MLDMPEYQEIQCNQKLLGKMKNLRMILIKKEVGFLRSPTALPNTLRVLEWWGYPATSLPSNFHLKKNLVMLNLSHSNFAWDKPLEACTIHYKWCEINLAFGWTLKSSKKKSIITVDLLFCRIQRFWDNWFSEVVRILDEYLTCLVSPTWQNFGLLNAQIWLRFMIQLDLYLIFKSFVSKDVPSSRFVQVA